MWGRQVKCIRTGIDRDRKPDVEARDKKRCDVSFMEGKRNELIYLLC